MATEQEQLQPTVNGFAAHIRRQGRRSVSADEEGRCLYRAPDGAACGIGGLIKDEHCIAKLENKSAWVPEVRSALALSGFANDEVSHAAIAALQECHDEADDEDFLADFEGRLESFCQKFGVTYPQVA